MKSAIVLVSGGLDSCVSTAWALSEGYACIPINFAYGQRHAREIIASELVCEALGLPTPRTFNLTQPFALIGGSSLTSGIRTGNPSTEAVERTPSNLPPSFVPGRNLLFLGIAAALAYVEQAQYIVGGWNVIDYSGYPDCRPEFFTTMGQAIGNAMGYARDAEHAIVAPLVHLRKDEIVQLGHRLNAPMHLTWSCYAGGSVPCNECDSCRIRIDGFAKAGIVDGAAV